MMVKRKKGLDLSQCSPGSLLPLGADEIGGEIGIWEAVGGWAVVRRSVMDQ